MPVKSVLSLGRVRNFAINALAAQLRIAKIGRYGGVAEWPIAPVLKTGNTKVFEGSNPSPSVFLVPPFTYSSKVLSRLKRLFQLQIGAQHHLR